MHREATVEQQLVARVRQDHNLLHAMGKPAPYRLLLQTGIEWLCIIVLAVAANWFSNGAVSILCMLLIATRQHALLALMHDYSHYQLSRRHAWLNDLIGDMFTALPFFITISGFRRNHFPHHRHAATDQDLNWVASLKKNRYRFPKTRTQIAIEIAKHCIGWYTLADFKGYTVDAGMAVNLPRITRINRAICTVFLVTAVTWFELWWTVFLYWIVPLSTFLMAILYVRDMGEHFGLAAPGIAGSRTIVTGMFERILICQNGVNFHTEHHLFPSVPFFRLRQLHDVLMQDKQYRHHAVVTRGYLTGLVSEVAASDRFQQVQG